MLSDITDVVSILEDVASTVVTAVVPMLAAAAGAVATAMVPVLAAVHMMVDAVGGGSGGVGVEAGDSVKGVLIPSPGLGWY